MNLLLDSANIDEIRKAVATRAFAGVTTNPSLMAKEEKGDYLTKLREIAKVIDERMKLSVRLSAALQTEVTKSMHLSVEVTTADPTKMADEALRIIDGISPHGGSLHIKIPVMLETLSVITELAKRKIQVNATACMIASQAKLASDAGAAVVSFFYRRMLDGGIRADNEIAEYRAVGGLAKIICGSIRAPEDVMNAWKAGADYVTAPMSIASAMMTHPKTTEAIARFNKDIEAWQK